MNWFYWNTAWSLFFSLVWFMTITHNPDAQRADRRWTPQGTKLAESLAKAAGALFSPGSVAGAAELITAKPRR
jgi:hypothetical protein